MTRLAVPRALLLPAIALATVACLSVGGLGPPRDPDVRGNLSGTFTWAVAEPTLAIGDLDPDGVRESVDRAAAVIDDDRDIGFGITVVAAFETAQRAEAHADDVQEVLEDAAAWYSDPRERAYGSGGPRRSRSDRAADAARRGGDDRASPGSRHARRPAGAVRRAWPMLPSTRWGRSLWSPA